MLFGGDAGVDTGDSGVTPTPDPSDTGTPEEPTEPTDPSVPADYEAALEQAREAMLDRDAALRAGDLTAFAEADARLTEAVEILLELQDAE